MSNLDMPDFLKRTETEAQAEARRKKNAPKNDSKGLKVVTPPDPKISAAVAKDFAEKTKDAKLANVKAFVEKGAAVQKAVDAQIAKAATKKREEAWKAPLRAKLKAVTAKKAPKPVGKKEAALREQRETKALFPTQHGDEAIPRNAKPPKAAAAPKKAGALVAKALQEREAMHAKAKTAISATNGKKPAKAKKSSSRYDWAAAEEAAKTGKVPATPDFSAPTHKCYRPRLAEIEKLVKAKNLKALKAMKESDFRKDGSPLIMNRYRKLAITALEA